MTRRARTSSSPTSAPSGGRDSARCPAAPSAATGVGLFYGEEAAARDLNMSAGGLALARARGEVDDMYVAVGRRILYSRIRPRLHALGLKTPADLGEFCKAAGIRDLAGLIEFLDAGEGGST